MSPTSEFVGLAAWASLSAETELGSVGGLPDPEYPLGARSSSRFAVGGFWGLTEGAASVYVPGTTYQLLSDKGEAGNAPPRRFPWLYPSRRGTICR